MSRLLAPPKHLYRISNLATVEPLARQLASYFPDPEQIVTAIYELLFNAIEHGNLGIGFAQKTRLVQNGTWEQEIYRRMKDPFYGGRKAMVTLERTPDYCMVQITDQGYGFNWKYYLNYDKPDTLPNGRGLYIVRQSGFDEVRFNERGNQVTCMLYTKAR
ncbi:MAG: ATP-binding protein [Alphaproteobacteria bacterium]